MRAQIEAQRARYEREQRRATKTQVIDTHLANPTWGATQIAHALGCTDAYVRVVKKRFGLAIPKSRRGIVPSHGAAYCRLKRSGAL